jgi:hypothetical protein
LALARLNDERLAVARPPNLEPRLPESRRPGPRLFALPAQGDPAAREPRVHDEEMLGPGLAGSGQRSGTVQALEGMLARAGGKRRVHREQPEPIERLLDGALILAADPAPLTLLEVLRDRHANEDGGATHQVGIVKPGSRSPKGDRKRRRRRRPPARRRPLRSAL